MSDSNGQNSGWIQPANWIVPSGPPPPSVASMTPSSGNGTTQTFTVQFNDPNEGLSFAHILFNTSLSDSQGCHVLYVAALNALYLMNDGGTSYLGPMTPGAAGALQNSQPQLNAAGTSITGLGGTAVTFRLPLTFSYSFGGAKLLVAVCCPTAAAKTPAGFSLPIG